MALSSDILGAESEALAGGIGDAATQTQSLFRAAMNAMAQPGQIYPASCDALPPAPLQPLMAGLLTMLADPETPVWLDDILRSEKSIQDWITFHIGAPIVDDPDQASFALINDIAGMPDLDHFNRGDQAYPDRSTTLLLNVKHMLADAGDLVLQGPGIDGTAKFDFTPQPMRFEQQWQVNQSFFPRGVDLMLVGEHEVACLPRSTRLVLERAE
ncbi:phosphonate C-P lyase system protein PhnH [Cohaesibacter gelatinilyticus]|uniref:Alpha-D-ribose 1-methylphosphonate 5-triphosphate synthase subunit PhnH n=1 Tax=Cohaesibacter gelatinilyticus TaxID=372072 RepID=A0A285NH18_9HYPH|nr:phosphonate C-P lyase system protein PhnH [Cohaesibacter gelatinilyticus]SNZ08760.1 alpha-D-ribose 1-methylphosphonate 5-triphosphate synthase subunit PhnH [Cohaesibacter gelatinilyticus]